MSQRLVPDELQSLVAPLIPPVGSRLQGATALLCPQDLKKPNQGRDDGGSPYVAGFPDSNPLDSDGLYIYNRTHIVADRYGGEWRSENLFTGYAQMNTSGMKRCENRIAAQLRAGNPVLYSGQLSYRDDSTSMPESIQMTAVTKGGVLFNTPVENLQRKGHSC